MAQVMERREKGRKGKGRGGLKEGNDEEREQA